MWIKMVEVPIIGCELELDERDPKNIRKSVRVDFGSGIATRLPLDTPGIEKLGVGVLVTADIELNSSSISPWNIPAEEGSNQPARSGHTLKGLIIKELSDGSEKVLIKPKLAEKDWSKAEPTRTRAAYVARGAAAPKSDVKSGGAQEEVEDEQPT